MILKALYRNKYFISVAPCQGTIGEAVVDVRSLTKSRGFGLQLFFVLSAFLIYELLMRERETTGAVSVKQFYIRRILRIWPLYYLGGALGFLYQFPNSGASARIVPLLRMKKRHAVIDSQPILGDR
jgi:hypothetical protein